MKVWTNTEFIGHYPVGTAAVVVADTPGLAATLLNAELRKQGLGETAKPEQFKRLVTTQTGVEILQDGNY